MSVHQKKKHKKSLRDQILSQRTVELTWVWKQPDTSVDAKFKFTAEYLILKISWLLFIPLSSHLNAFNMLLYVINRI